MLLLIKRKITILFQALNFQTAVVSPGHILPPSAVDASIEAFCSFSPSQFQALNITEKYKINFQLVIFLDKQTFVLLHFLFSICRSSCQNTKDSPATQCVISSESNNSLYIFYSKQMN